MGVTLGDKKQDAVTAILKKLAARTMRAQEQIIRDGVFVYDANEKTWVLNHWEIFTANQLTNLSTHLRDGDGVSVDFINNPGGKIIGIIINPEYSPVFGFTESGRRVEKRGRECLR